MFNLFKKKNAPTYKFKEPENTACFICEHVFNRERPILYVSHDREDGAWQFMCGQNDHIETNVKIISLKHATEIDEGINDLYEMPPGVGAQRETTASKWVPFRHS